MRLADKLYEIIDYKYYKFCREEGAPKGYYFGRLGNEKHTSVELILKWHQMLNSNGMTTSTEFIDRPDLACIKDPAILHNEWILIPNEIAMKIVVLGDLP